ncbi:MAG TPA: hypothetical protein VNZ85_08275 [Caulobacter sp.]|nr:hypothetical protein [Caulobacter sp.]
MRRLFILGCALAVSPAEASEAQLGNIVRLFATSNGAVMFDTTGARTTAPACQGAAVPNRFAINGSTVAGQSQLAALMTAYSLRKRIWIYGSGTCTIWSDTETVSWFWVED